MNIIPLDIIKEILTYLDNRSQIYLMSSSAILNKLNTDEYWNAELCHMNGFPSIMRFIARKCCQHNEVIDITKEIKMIIERSKRIPYNVSMMFPPALDLIVIREYFHKMMQGIDLSHISLVKLQKEIQDKYAEHYA